MSRVADRMLKVMGEVDQLSKFNSQVFQGIKEMWGEKSEEFKMIKEIDSKIDDLLTLLNDEDEDLNDDNNFNMEWCNGYQDEIPHAGKIEDLNSEE